MKCRLTMKKSNLFKSFMVTMVCALVILGANATTVYAATEPDPYYVDLGYEYDLYTCGIVDFDSREIEESECDPAIIINFEVPENGTISISNSLEDVLLVGNDGVFRSINCETEIPVTSGDYNIYSWLDWSHVYDLYDPAGYERYDDFVISFTPSNVEVESNDLFDEATELEGKLYGLITPTFSARKKMSSVGRYDVIDNDIDTYHFTITTPSKIMVSIATESPAIYTQIYSEDEDGNIELLKDVKENQYTNLPIGSYFVRISKKDSYNHLFASYEIELITSEISGNIEFENNNSEETANEIIANETYTGSISSKKDKDYFVITFDEDAEVTFVTKVPREKAKELYSFSVMRKDSRGNLVNIISYKSTKNPSVKEKFSAKAGMTYYLIVKSGNKKYDANVDYSFTFKVEEPEVAAEDAVVENTKEIVEEVIDENVVEADLEIELGDTVKLPKFKGQKNVTSDDSTIVSIAKGNKLTGNAVGVTTITFLGKNDKVIQSYIVAVIEEVTDEDAVEADLEIELGDTVKLPKVKGQKKVTTDDNKIVSIAKGNKFTGKALGITTITFLDKNDKVLQSYTVAVVEPER